METEKTDIISNDVNDASNNTKRWLKDDVRYGLDVGCAWIDFAQPALDKVELTVYLIGECNLEEEKEDPKTYKTYECAVWDAVRFVQECVAVGGVVRWKGVDQYIGSDMMSEEEEGAVREGWRQTVGWVQLWTTQQHHTNTN